ncbi:hypothetical protein SI65_04484 [Aspergillus cristatus]|uniref:Uncharacterized protein n=1 Tax=Aspergillus cristatus TaxID=573508 RepID=A0A1E3BEV3_ASPCR|nr:hypothetical protein SI65_04484 [Aspergillus cristatus]
MGTNGKQSAPQVDDANSTTTSGSNPPMRKKRARSGDSNENGVELSRLQDSRSQKRKRVEIPGTDEDLRNTTPVSAETEDISEEVQRRLEIKEEQRKRRNAKPEKRKRDRDSLLSNDGISSLGDTARPKKKRREEQTG